MKSSLKQSVGSRQRRELSKYMKLAAQQTQEGPETCQHQCYDVMSATVSPGFAWRDVTHLRLVDVNDRRPRPRDNDVINTEHRPDVEIWRQTPRRRGATLPAQMTANLVANKEAPRSVGPSFVMRAAAGGV